MVSRSEVLGELRFGSYAPHWKILAERVGFSNAIYYLRCAFNEMPQTDVFTVSYVLSHLQHWSHKER